MDGGNGWDGWWERLGWMVGTAGMDGGKQYS